MADYQSILSISVLHEYYNASSDKFAPIRLIADRETVLLLREYGILLKSAQGFAQLIVDTVQFSDLADLTAELAFRFYLVSTDPGFRNITEMPDMFDISILNAEFTGSADLDITAKQWVDVNQLITSATIDNAVIHNKNFIGLLTISLPKSHCTLEKKSITLRFNAISAYWKYYILSAESNKNLNIPRSFTEQEPEQVANKTARIFMSNNPIPLRKIYVEPLSLLDANNVVIKSLPLPNPENISTSIVKDLKIAIAHVYVN
ncbi:hypothetical protein U0868_18850 [Kluyvera ascorbata]|uniref:hypothetical protein n=1 Tax=Kluyvera ascorbata TaxID=51288 RepID=UPI002ABB0DEF|nr:hypothetical protein [Kluyvera ascorbata]MDZ4033616.1 hypothetical protein [Kluyvera ascorbata]